MYIPRYFIEKINKRFVLQVCCTNLVRDRACLYADAVWPDEFGEKIAQNVAQAFFCQHLYRNWSVEKKFAQNLALFA
jgi:hypothetical protein